ncbi:MAG: DUF87 domain-containing protein [Bacteroidota bacterium]
MESLFYKILTKNDVIKVIVAKSQKYDIDMKSIGKICDSRIYETQHIVPLMNIWCQRIDKLIEIDKLSHHDHTWRSKKLLRWRGFTFKEYYQLFNPSIVEEEFVFHPVFNQLNKFNSGIETQAEREFYLNTFEYNEGDYIKALLEAKMEDLLVFFYKHINVVFPFSSLQKHAHVTGQTGKGKSEFLRLLFYSLQKRSQKKRKYSLVLIDPHGDLAEKIMKSHLNKDHDRLVYFAPKLDSDRTPIINPLQLKDESLLEKTTEFIVEAFDELMRDQSLSDQMRTILTPCVYTLLKRGNANLEDLQRFMLNDPELISLGRQSEIKPHRDFFVNNFEGTKGRDPYTITKKAIFTRIQNLINFPMFYNMTMGESTVDLGKCLNGGKVVVFDLKGLGGVSKEAFGRFIIAKIKAIASNRERIPEERRKPTFVFIDECQNFITSSISKTLSEMRKYGLHLILAHQYIEQLGYLTGAVLSNTDMKVVFENHESTLQKFSSYMDMTVKEMRTQWKKYECYVKVGGRRTIKFKPSSKLLSKKKYSLTKEQESALRKYTLDTYYDPIGQTSIINTKPNKQKKKKDITPPHSSILLDDDDF